MSNTLVLSTPCGELHGLINTLTNSVPFDDFKSMKPEHKKEMERQKKEDSKLVKVEYLNSRGRHERLTKPYCRYAGDPIHVYHLIPGKSYDLPMGFIKEVNDTNKIMKQRSGLVSIDDAPVNQNSAPLDNDQEGTWLHRLVASGF